MCCRRLRLVPAPACLCFLIRRTHRLAYGVLEFQGAQSVESRGILASDDEVGAGIHSVPRGKQNGKKNTIYLSVFDAFRKGSFVRQLRLRIGALRAGCVLLLAGIALPFLEVCRVTRLGDDWFVWGVPLLWCIGHALIAFSTHRQTCQLTAGVAGVLAGVTVAFVLYVLGIQWSEGQGFALLRIMICFGLPLLLLTLITLVFAAVESFKAGLWFYRMQTGYCPSCNYNLTGNVSGVCPECGTPMHCNQMMEDGREA